jgi:hypothetical protein
MLFAFMLCLGGSRCSQRVQAQPPHPNTLRHNTDFVTAQDDRMTGPMFISTLPNLLLFSAFLAHIYSYSNISCKLYLPAIEHKRLLSTHPSWSHQNSCYTVAYITMPKDSSRRRSLSRPSRRRFKRAISRIPRRSSSIEGCSSDCSPTPYSRGFPYLVLFYKTSLKGRIPALIGNYDYFHHDAVWTPFGGFEFERKNGHLIAGNMNPGHWKRFTEDGLRTPYLKVFELGYTTKGLFRQAKERAKEITGSVYTASNNCQTAAKEIGNILVDQTLSSHRRGSLEAKAQLNRFERHRRKYLKTGLELHKARHGLINHALTNVAGHQAIHLVLKPIWSQISRFRNSLPKGHRRYIHRHKDSRPERRRHG